MAKKKLPQPDFILPGAGPLVHKRATVPHLVAKNVGGGPPKDATNRQRFLHAWEYTFGNISASCEYAAIDRRTFYRWKRRWEKDRGRDYKTLSRASRLNIRFFDKLELIRPVERKKDFYEAALDRQAAFGDTTAIIFGLKTQAKDRGYVEKLEIQQPMTDELRTELTLIKRKIEEVAGRFETDYPTELREYLNEFGTTLNPVIRQQLSSELEQ